MTIVLTFIAVIFLAYSNGANDNFKGVATLYGSKTINYKNALIWTSITTLLGSIFALYIASELIIVFKGEGLVPNQVIQLDSFPLAVGFAAALTVMLATILRLPVSTTHALIGALSGAGIMASNSGINWTSLLSKFFLPLIGGPVISLLLAYLMYPLFKVFKEKIIVKKLTKKVGTTPVAANILLSKYLDSPIVLKQDPSYQVLTKNYFYNHVIEKLHFISSGLVCFARGLNDTPKIAALLLIGSRFHIEFSIIAVGLFILIGGLIHSKSIAKTMGENITSMDGEQALTANLVAGFMVLFASRLGVPVSTTHVSCGAIFGIGASKKDLDFKTLKNILLAWVTTLPLGFLVGALIMYILTF